MKIKAVAVLTALSLVAAISVGCNLSDVEELYYNTYYDIDREIEMVQIPAGTFTIGSTSGGYSNERPTRQVTISAFKMSKCEVTQGQYQKITGNNPSSFRGKGLPVECVTWLDAVEFCNKLSQSEGLTPVYTITNRSPSTGYPITSAAVTANWTANGYRLPTEAEWEYACRAGSTTTWCFGDDESLLGSYAWYLENSNGKTHPVGQKRPNAWGLYDMHGNVWEWCWDWYGAYPSSAETDPRGPISGSYRVGRGGSYWSNANDTRSASRGADYPGSGYYVGFRVVRL